MPLRLVDFVIEAHGGWPRWTRLSRFRASGSITGAIWAMKATAGLFDDIVLDGQIGNQRITITPFPKQGYRTTWEPLRQTIENTDGRITQERLNPAARFVGQTRTTPWDLLQAAYFAGEANWNYFAAPFLFARDDVGTEEIEPWHENGEVWRSLLVTYPDSIVAHSRQQTYYFDDVGMLRRLDYAVEILGSNPAVHYPSRYRSFDGIAVPTRRRVYSRNLDGTPIIDAPSVAIDFTNVSFN